MLKPKEFKNFDIESDIPIVLSSPTGEASLYFTFSS